MKNSYAFLGAAMAIVLFIWLSINSHYLSLQNDKTPIMASLLVAVVFAIVGILMIPY